MICIKNCYLPVNFIFPRLRKIFTVLATLIFFFFFLISCKEKPTSNNHDISVKVLKGIRLSPLIDSLFGNFQKEQPDAPAYAIFIDKKSEGLSNYVITMAPFSKKINNIYESGAANYFTFRDSIPVVIYSGLEDFLFCDSLKYLEAKKIYSEQTGEFKNVDYFNKFINFSKSISYVHHDTSTFIVKDEVPFIDLKINRPIIFFDPNYSKEKSHSKHLK